VWKDATELFGRMPPNCSICKSAVQQQEIGVIEGRKPGGHGQDMGQRKPGGHGQDMGQREAMATTWAKEP